MDIDFTLLFSSDLSSGDLTLIGSTIPRRVTEEGNLLKKGLDGPVANLLAIVLPMMRWVKLGGREGSDSPPSIVISAPPMSSFTSPFTKPTLASGSLIE